MNQIQITIQAPELVEAMNKLTAALMNGQVQPAQVEELKEQLEDEAEVKAEADKPKKEPKPKKAEPEKKEITIEDVRGKLALLAQQGKQNEVKALIASYGVGKLTEIDKSQFEDLLLKAEAL